jgi:hypothetical protein
MVFSLVLRADVVDDVNILAPDSVKSSIDILLKLSGSHSQFWRSEPSGSSCSSLPCRTL